MNRDGNYNVVFGAMGSIISDPMLDAYIEKKEERPTRVLISSDAVKYFAEWAEEKKEVPGHNFIEGLTMDAWRRKLDSEKVILEQPVQLNVVPNVSENAMVSPVQTEVKTEESVIPQINEEIKPVEVQNNVITPSSEVAPVTPEATDNQVNTMVQEPVNQGPVVSVSETTIGKNEPVQQNSSGIAPIDRSYEQNVPVVENQGPVRTLARAGFVKFPIFLLTILAIGSLGIFVGKMFYTYLSQQ